MVNVQFIMMLCINPDIEKEKIMDQSSYLKICKSCGEPSSKENCQTCKILKTVPMGYKEKEALRREYKEQLKQFKAAAKQGNNSQSHPLTGDLSRFTSTAGNNSRGG